MQLIGYGFNVIKGSKINRNIMIHHNYHQIILKQLYE